MGLEISDLVTLGQVAPMLAWVDPYGKTVFNGRQCQVLVREVRKALEDGEQDSLALLEIERLCLRLLSRQHHYLWFIGD